MCRVHCVKSQARWSTSWNQDYRERYQWSYICRWHHPYGKKWRRTKEPLDESERGEWKSGLKIQHSKNEDDGIWSHHFMANRWGKKWEQWLTLFSRAPRSLQIVTIAMKLKNMCCLEEKLTNIDSILKIRDITLPTEVRLVKAMVFPIVLYGCETRTIKIAQCWRIDVFELWRWRRLLRISWTARSNQSILKEIITDYSLKGLMLKLQNVGHLMKRADSLEKTLMLGKIEGRRRRGWQRLRWSDGITDSMDMSLN